MQPQKGSRIDSDRIAPVGNGSGGVNPVVGDHLTFNRCQGFTAIGDFLNLPEK